jgi:uncharacterized lipoprotein YmbA
MNRLAPPLRQGIASTFVLLAAGCSPLAPQPDLSRFYVLTSLAESGREPVRAADRDLSLGVGPVTLAPYLDRTTLVTRVGTNQVEFSQIDRWAEPLSGHFARIQATNLGTLLGTQVLLHPWYSSTRLDYSVEIYVLRFERDSRGSAQLKALWAVRDGDSGRILDTRESSFTESASAETTEASVVALSKIAADLSREIADTIRNLESKRP